MGKMGRNIFGVVGVGVMGGAMMAIGLSASMAHAITPVSYDWALRINEGRVSDAVLAYEVEGTDNQRLAFVCEEGSGGVHATIVGMPLSLRQIMLEAGDQQWTAAGTSVETEIPEMPVFTSVRIAADQPVFDAFAETASLTLLAQNEEYEMEASVRAKGQIAKFLQFCRG